MCFLLRMYAYDSVERCLWFSRSMLMIFKIITMVPGKHLHLFQCFRAYLFIAHFHYFTIQFPGLFRRLQIDYDGLLVFQGQNDVRRGAGIPQV